MSNLTKREMIDQSIDGMFRLLNDIVRDPARYVEDAQILDALVSQGGLCSLSMEFSIHGESIVIRPISVNTLKKRLAGNASDRDLAYLDRLRIHAHRALERYNAEPADAPKKRTRTALEDQVEELKASVATLQAVNMVLIQALEVNRRDMITIADTPGTGLRQKRIQDAMDRIIKILALNPAPFDDVTILSMKSHLHLVPSEKQNH